MIKIAINILFLLNFSLEVFADGMTQNTVEIEKLPQTQNSFYQQSVDKLFITGSKVINHIKENKKIYSTIAIAGIVMYCYVQTVDGENIDNQNLNTACPFNLNLCFNRVTGCDGPCVFTYNLKDFYLGTCTRLMEVTNATFNYGVGDWKDYITSLYHINNCQYLNADNDYVIRLSSYPEIMHDYAICRYQIFRMTENITPIGTLMARISNCLSYS